MTSPSPDVVDVLVEARKLIERPEDWWSKPTSKRVSNRYTRRPNERCAVVALQAASNRSIKAYRGAWDALRGAMRTNIAGFNDTHTHAEVLAAFDRAIASARQERTE